MTVRIWMRPNELGECGYHVDFEGADNYCILKNKTLVLTTDAREDTGEVGRVQGERWDAVMVMEDS